jgi:hypothetical protein
MKTLLASALLVGAMATAAMAEEVVVLTDAQMDDVKAGLNISITFSSTREATQSVTVEQSDISSTNLQVRIED